MPTLHGTYQALIQDHKTTEMMKDDYHWTCEYCLGHQINYQTTGLTYFVLWCWNISNTLTCIIFNKVLVDIKSCIFISSYKNPD